MSTRENIRLIARAPMNGVLIASNSRFQNDSILITYCPLPTLSFEAVYISSNQLQKGAKLPT